VAPGGLLADEHAERCPCLSRKKQYKTSTSIQNVPLRFSAHDSPATKNQ
jgi:hypothetical protein